ncbi:hypothetical protein R1sor_018100 [Riccia sorocarpa]|uniref:Reverse transcriptase domain-containing protein n=1 Tax=Riccia sorocarpa TaxID=122646 RepID=A0ABD3I8Q2_9MARC
MRFSHEFISLIGGLIAQGTAKVHTNGLSTQAFPLERWVRQGCPVSPILSVLSTQPLMRLFRKSERKGELEGLNIPNGRSILHRLFAEDSGVTIKASEDNFKNLTKVIEKFERVSGAQLNLAKSVVIPMALERLPSWLESSGCKILREGEEITYLGVKASLNVEEVTHERDLATKLTKKLSTWANRSLSWTSKVRDAAAGQEAGIQNLVSRRRFITTAHDPQQEVYHKASPAAKLDPGEITTLSKRTINEPPGSTIHEPALIVTSPIHHQFAVLGKNTVPFAEEMEDHNTDTPARHVWVMEVIAASNIKTKYRNHRRPES